MTQQTSFTIDKGPVVVPGGSFSNLIKVESEYETEFLGIAVTGSITEWYALDVGMIWHIGVVEALGTVAVTDFKLRSHQVD